jgi:hypothetical protein
MRKLLLATAATMGALLATAGGAKAQPVKPVAPGTIVVHLNGYLQFEVADFGSTDNTVGAAKLNPISADGDVRLYPGFDAQTTNGIDYGAQVELRTATSDNTNGSNSKSGSYTSNPNGVSSLFVRRAYGYIGNPDAGFIRGGQTDSAFGLLQTGVIEAFGDGAQWNTYGGPATIIPTDASVAGSNQFIYADQSNLYATDKIVYISPTLYGFSGAVGFEPNSNGFGSGYGNCAAASSNNGATAPQLTCADVSASPDASNIGKERKNTIDAAVEYVLKANGFATKANFGVLHGSPIDYDGAAVATGALHYGYDSLNVYQFGAQTTFAGLTLGANVKTGQTLDGYTFKVRGTRDALAYIVGGNYVIGPYVVGASFFDSQSAGSYTPGAKEARTLSEYGAAVGGNYIVGKDLSLFVQYMYDHRHQHGNTGLDLNNTAKGVSQAQIIATGATFKW